MKLSHLLSQFLFSQKQISLAGIGRFSVDDSGTISFEQDKSVKEDPVLVNYLSEQSGKMKSLMAADLDSYLELARQFLNIGKPYLFEGIGTLAKNKFGKFDFEQSNSLVEKKEPVEGRDTTSTTENSFTDYQEMFSPKKSKALTTKKIVTWFIGIAGISLAVFGGYLVYTKTKNKKITAPTQQGPTTPVVNTPTPVKPKDSIPATTTLPDSSTLYRFVIETAGRERAFKRFSDLKSYGLDIKMDTRDSVLFKLYFLKQAKPSDTSSIKNSLAISYGRNSKVSIELN